MELKLIVRFLVRKLSCFVLLSFMLAMSACSSGDDAKDVSSVDKLKMHVFECGRYEGLDKSSFASNGELEQGGLVDVVVTCYLIRHPQGDFIWDTGLPDAFNAQENGVAMGPTIVASVPVTLASQLEKIGVAPADIEFVAVSHSHPDHAGNVALFAGSTFLIDKVERDYMFRDEVRAHKDSYALIAPIEASEMIEFDGEYDVFGDGAVVIKPTPGHTPGHTSLFVALPETGPVLLSGDLYVLKESREQRLVPIFNVDETKTLASMDAFETLAAETNARVIIQHSEEQFNNLPASRVLN
ncbi:MAG: MBL fold metallo-hydrolase [Hyphococcus sp.]|nr:MAG: MBL fold metallo-hydrolase [Marinicaulis sp.]